MFRGSGLAKLKRFACGIVGVVAIASGLYYSRGAYAYSHRNWFDGLIFGPVVTALGIVALIGAVFNWRKIWDSPHADDARKKRS